MEKTTLAFNKHNSTFSALLHELNRNSLDDDNIQHVSQHCVRTTPAAVVAAAAASTTTDATFCWLPGEEDYAFIGADDGDNNLNNTDSTNNVNSDENDDVFSDSENQTLDLNHLNPSGGGDDDDEEEEDNNIIIGPPHDEHRRLFSAAAESIRSQSLTPLLKHELKYLIQVRRVSQGKEEMKVQFQHPSTCQLSAAEVERVERRRNQNRIAARRFRQKRKRSEEDLLQAINSLQQTNMSLQQQVQELRNEKQSLLNTVAEHLLACPFLCQLPMELLGADSVP